MKSSLFVDISEYLFSPARQKHRRLPWMNGSPGCPQEFFSDATWFAVAFQCLYIPSATATEKPFPWLLKILSAIGTMSNFFEYAGIPNGLYIF